MFPLYLTSWCDDFDFGITTPDRNALYLAECSNYSFLNESNRAQTFYRGKRSLCDRTLTTGWYRFGGEAGQQMPESCVDLRHCGTIVPGWLNGTHPMVEDGAVKRKVCFHSPSGNCCKWSTDVLVRNCGGFYVYKLKKTPQCDLRYCGNGSYSEQGSFANFRITITIRFRALVPTSSRSLISTPPLEFGFLLIIVSLSKCSHSYKHPNSVSVTALLVPMHIEMNHGPSWGLVTKTEVFVSLSQQLCPCDQSTTVPSNEWSRIKILWQLFD